MAAGKAHQELYDEATCPICLDYFTDPVTTTCRHNFCLACIKDLCQPNMPAFCPQCRAKIKRRMLRPNRKLRKLVEIIKSIEEGEGAERRVCQVLFCMDDQALICVACHPTSKHKGHNLVPMEKAAQEYKVRQCELVLWLTSAPFLNAMFPTFQREIEMQKRMIKSEFQKTESFLHAKERHQLAQLEDLKIEAEVKQNENITRFSEEISCLTELISEMEKKCQQPASEFLQVRLSIKTPPNTWEIKRPCIAVFLDNKQANPHMNKKYEFILSNSVLPRYQDLPEKPGRFSRETLVGRGHVGYGHRKRACLAEGDFRLNPQEGVWAVGKRPPDSSSAIQLSALTSPEWTPLTLTCEPRKIRVSLDYEGGRVAFINADSDELIFTFYSASCSGERSRPFFRAVSGVRMSC
uniref:Uncharacterized protein n=1 Tax=Varanus komodoensis TaxID=61221 RepID=A0A8D2IY76_VARKO